MINQRLRKQIQFVLELDRLKSVLRRSTLLDGSKQEDDAEHSWHIAMMALMLSEYYKDGKFDQFKSVKMLLIHDIVEIDAGDTYCYDDYGHLDKEQREQQAADRIFGLLPDDQSQEILEIWEEFEEGRSDEAKFANMMDRLEPFLLNYYSGGPIWVENNISKAQVLQRMSPVKESSEELWALVSSLIDDAIEKGYLRK